VCGCVGCSLQAARVGCGARPVSSASVFGNSVGFLFPGHPSRLTVRSSRPRIVASAVCFALRLHTSAAPPRGGLTQALGAEETFCRCVVRASVLSGSFAALFGIFLGAFGLRSLCSARSGVVNLFFMASVGRHSCCCVGASGCFVRQCGCQCAGRARFSRLRSFGNGTWASLFSGSHAPNNSFKPTPYLGFVETSRLASNTGPSLPRSARLNSGVRRQKSV
jgi:hypothetical protein